MARLRIDATGPKVRRKVRIVSVAGIVAVGVGVGADGRREGLGRDIGLSAVVPVRTAFRRRLARRGRRGLKLVPLRRPRGGLKAAIPKVLGASWQRLPRPLREECAGPCRQERAVRRLRLRRHRLRPGRPDEREAAVTSRRRPAPRESPESCRGDWTRTGRASSPT